jgi:hypothetical protein
MLPQSNFGRTALPESGADKAALDGPGWSRIQPVAAPERTRPLPLWKDARDGYFVNSVRSTESPIF